MQELINVKEGRQILVDAGIKVSEWKFHDLLRTGEIDGRKLPSKSGKGHWLVKRESVAAFIKKVLS